MGKTAYMTVGINLLTTCFTTKSEEEARSKLIFRHYCYCANTTSEILPGPPRPFEIRLFWDQRQHHGSQSCHPRRIKYIIIYFNALWTSETASGTFSRKKVAPAA